MSKRIYEGLALFGEEGILWVVLGILLLFFVLGLRFEKYRQAAPALMTSTGILGTFCGIFIALYPLDFAPGNMNDSIEALLNGMRTAFVTSLLGIGFGIVFRTVDRTPLGNSIGSLLSRFDDAPKGIPPEQREILDRLDAIKQAIAGDGDSSMVTQMQKMRDENRDGFQKLDGLTETIREALVKNLEGLAEDIREIIGKQLGESLQNLIGNIEKALIEQFGKTFVEFNEATQALKKWQEDHRRQVEQLTDAFNLAADRIERIAADCEKIPPTMEQLRNAVEITDREVTRLLGSVQTFAAMHEQAEKAFPAIEQHLDEIGLKLESGATQFSGFEETIRKAFQSGEQELRRIAQQHSADVKTVTDNMRQTLEDAQQDSATKVAGIIQDAGEKFANEMNSEISRVAREWGANMLSIAERCAEVIGEVDRRK